MVLYLCREFLAILRLLAAIPAPTVPAPVVLIVLSPPLSLKTQVGSCIIDCVLVLPLQLCFRLLGGVEGGWGREEESLGNHREA